MGIFKGFGRMVKKIVEPETDIGGDDFDFEGDARALTAKERQINAGGRQNGVDRIIAADTTPDFQDQEEETPKKFGLLSGLKKAGKFVGDNAEMIMPAVYGLSQGVGVLPGLMYGLAAKNQRKATDLELGREAAEKQADLDWKKEMLKQQGEQKDLDRKTRKEIAMTPRPSATTAQDEQDWNDLNELYQTRDALMQQGYTEAEVFEAHPQMKSLITVLEQKTKTKKSLAPDEVQAPLEIETD